MLATRTTLSGTVVAGVALAAALVLASAPAASPPTAARALTATGGTYGAAEGDRGDERLRPSRTDERLRDDRDGRLARVRAPQPNNVHGKTVRVVVETDDPALARAAVLAVGGQVERTAGGLLQALVAPGQLRALGRRPGARRVRASSVRIETALGGEEIVPRPRVRLARQGHHGEGREGRDRRRRVHGPRGSSGRRRSSREHRDPGLLRWRTDHCRRPRHRGRGDRPRDGTRRAAVPRLRRRRGRLPRGSRIREEPGRVRRQPVDGLGGPVSRRR